MMAPKRERMAYSVSFTEKSENAAKISRMPAAMNTGNSRELISAPPAACFDRDPFRFLGCACGGLDRLVLAPRALREELVDRQVDEIVARVSVDQHLVCSRQHVLDRVGIEPAARHVWCLLIGRLELREA